MEDNRITNALLSNGLLDDEGYLLPPNHKNVENFTKQLFKMTELKQLGVKLSPQDQNRLREMNVAYDYYQDALEEEANLQEGEYEDNTGEDEDEGEDDYEEYTEEDESYNDEDDDNTDSEAEINIADPK
jgi:hypothetical protein